MTAQYLTVIDFNTYADVEASKYGVDNLHQLHLVEQRVAAYHIGIALIKLTVASLLRAIGHAIRAESGSV